MQPNQVNLNNPFNHDSSPSRSERSINRFSSMNGDQAIFIVDSPGMRAPI